MTIEWRTYIPDGRPISILRQGDLWKVTCAEREAIGPSLYAAMAEATGQGGGELLSLRGGADAALDVWLREQAQAIEAEYDAAQRGG